MAEAVAFHLYGISNGNQVNHHGSPPIFQVRLFSPRNTAPSSSTLSIPLQNPLLHLRSSTSLPNPVAISSPNSKHITNPSLPSILHNLNSKMLQELDDGSIDALVSHPKIKPSSSNPNVIADAPSSSSAALELMLPTGQTPSITTSSSMPSVAPACGTTSASAGLTWPATPCSFGLRPWVCSSSLFTLDLESPRLQPFFSSSSSLFSSSTNPHTQTWGFFPTGFEQRGG